MRVATVSMKQGDLNFLCSFCITLPTVSALGFLLPALPACLAVCLSVCLSLCLCPPLISLPVLASPCPPCTCLTPDSPLSAHDGKVVGQRAGPVPGGGRRSQPDVGAGGSRKHRDIVMILFTRPFYSLIFEQQNCSSGV